MQGTWVVQATSKSASYAQRFVIQGSSNLTENFTHEIKPSDLTLPRYEVTVHGDNWVIDIQNKPKGKNWRSSEMQVTPPVKSGGVYQFTIESNDAGSDADFNDLILTCYTPVTGTDFIVHGKARYYDWRCIANPCFESVLGIDTLAGLKEGSKVSALRDALLAVYPEKVSRLLRNPGSAEATRRFKPVIIPLTETAQDTRREAVTMRLEPSTIEVNTEPRKKEKLSFDAPRDIKVVSYATAAASEKLSRSNRVDLSRYRDRLEWNCHIHPLPSVEIRFFEYDRTTAELTGGAFTLEGNREFLGSTFTDRNGYFIFRYQRSLLDAAQEVYADLSTGLGEDYVVQSKPDLILQLFGDEDPSTPLYETGLYRNVDFLHYINICIPDSALETIPFVCGDNDNMIQALGRVELGVPGNDLHADGKITCSILGQLCAAWRGVVEMKGCMRNADIYYYTIRYKKAGETDAKLKVIPDNLTQYRYVAADSSVSAPVDVTTEANLDIKNDSTKVKMKAFFNCENYLGDDPANPIIWRESARRIKAKLSTGRYFEADAPSSGSLEFVVNTFDKDGNHLPYEERVPLYFDNLYPDADILDDVQAAGQTLGHCALFKLSDRQMNEPIVIKILVDHETGFIHNYRVSMLKGAVGGNAIVVREADVGLSAVGKMSSSPNNTGRNFVETTPNCLTGFRGTLNEPDAEIDTAGYYTIELEPASSNGWLEPDEDFCAFSIELHGHTRHTNGYNDPRHFEAREVNIGIQRFNPIAP